MKYKILLDLDPKAKHPINFELRISKTVSDMNDDIDSFYGENCIEQEPEIFLGMFHPMSNSSDEGLFGVMWLNETNLGAGLISHECLHASLAYERQIIGEHCFYGDECGPDEERLCDILGLIMKTVVNCLYANNHIKEANG